MKEHFSEADLLETWYTQPGASMPVMMHVADCAECAERYERLEKKVRGLSACDRVEKPDTFWIAQREAVLRRTRFRPFHRFTRAAAAAMLAIVLGGTLTWQVFDGPQQVVTPAVTTANAPADVVVPSDPWESGELSSYHEIVDWESWVDNGGQS